MLVFALELAMSGLGAEESHWQLVKSAEPSFAGEAQCEA